MTTGLPLPVTWSLDGVVFNGPPDAAGREWVISGESGWSGSPPVRTGRTPIPGRPGAYRSPVYRDPRLIRLDGWVYAPTPAARREAEHLLNALCSDPSRLYELRCTEETGGMLAYVEQDAETFVDIVSPLWVDFSLQLAAPDPRKFSATERTARTALYGDGIGGVAWSGPDGTTGVDYAPGIDWGRVGSTGRMTITNDGTAEADIAFTLTGTRLVRPRLTEVIAGRTLLYLDTVRTGDVLRIDGADRTVLLDGVNKRPRLAPAQWFRVAPRSAIEVRFTADAPDPTAQAVATWRDSY